MIEAIFWMAAGAAFYHFFPRIAVGVWKQLKKVGNVRLPF